MRRPEGKRPLVRSRLRREDNIKKELQSGMERYKQNSPGS